MPLDQEVKDRIDQAVNTAMVEFRQFATTNPDAARWFADWLARHKNAATYKYIGQAIVAESKMLASVPSEPKSRP